MEQILLTYDLLERNCYSYNDALQKHESNGSLTWWGHRHCPKSFAWRYISAIFIYKQSKVRTTNSNKNGFTLNKDKSRRYHAKAITDTHYGKCPWCNGYRLRKWTRWHEFKSWTILIAFHIALIPLGKVWIQLFSLQLWVNSSVI